MPAARTHDARTGSSRTGTEFQRSPRYAWEPEQCGILTHQPGLIRMADVFVSYARADKARVAPLVAAIEAKGWSVWWDPEISPGREFDDEIDVELQAAKSVLVEIGRASCRERV